jgi:hypothetical protein
VGDIADQVRGATAKAEGGAECIETPDGIEFRNVKTDQPLDSDWSAVFARFGKDPRYFRIKNDTVKMRISEWQQSRRTDDGDRDTVTLHSYSYDAAFERLSQPPLSDEEIAEHRRRVQRWKLPKSLPVAGTGQSVAAVINLADIQGGKSEGGGVQATIDRMLDGLENAQQWLNRCAEFHQIDEVVIVNNGDPLEGCDGSYTSQMFTVELDMRGQMNFVLDMWETYARTLFPQFEKGRFVSVLCNHGQLSRQSGRDNRTTDADNAGGFLAETLQRILRERSEFDHVRWTIPHDEMVVYAEAAGVPMAFCHGHKIPKSDATGFETWLNGQVRGDAQAHNAKIWVTAHRHNFQAFDLGSTAVFQAPSLDGGSKWYRDRTGRYARAGLIAFLVGDHFPLKWDSLAFL